MPDAYLGLGGNLGDRGAQLAAAVARLHRPPALRVGAVSSVYESKPVGVTAQPDFLNLVVRVHTALSPRGLLAECLSIEAELGRVRRERWGPRIIDIDILLYDDLVEATGGLTLPHPRMTERCFVLTPLAEIAPALTIGGKSVHVLASQLDQGALRKLGRLALPTIPTLPRP